MHVRIILGYFYVDLGNLDVELWCYSLFLVMESVGNLNAIFGLALDYLS